MLATLINLVIFMHHAVGLLVRISLEEDQQEINLLPYMHVWQQQGKCKEQDYV